MTVQEQISRLNNVFERWQYDKMSGSLLSYSARIPFLPQNAP